MFILMIGHHLSHVMAAQLSKHEYQKLWPDYILTLYSETCL